MTKLSQIAFEAERLLGHMHESRRLSLQRELIDLCESHWQELRGPEPGTPLAYAVWSITPPLADLFADLYTAGDARLGEVLLGHRPAWGLALLVLAEIARGNAEGAQIAHEPMMACESETAGKHYMARMADLLRGGRPPPAPHKHAQLPPLQKALVAIASFCGRGDFEAALEAVRLLAASRDSSDAALEELRSMLEEIGISFVTAEDGLVRYTQRGHAHKAATFGEIGDALLEIRRNRLG